MTLGCVILPFDVLTGISASSETTGWLGGASVQDEYLFVVTAATTGSGAKVCDYVTELFSHYVYQGIEGTLSDEMLRWCTVDVGFFEKFPAYQWWSTEEFTSALGLAPEKLHGEMPVICIVERGTKADDVRSFFIRTKDDKTKLRRLETVVLTQNPDPFKRLPQEMVASLQDKRVAIVGVGSGGGEIALNLACAGVGNFDLFDPDRLHEENYIRHVLDRKDLGRTKLKGFKSELLNRNLKVSVEEHYIDVLFFADAFREGLSKTAPDLLICATDSRDSRRLINVCGVLLDIPIIIAGTLHSGKIGEVLLIYPRKTACYECIRERLGTVLEATDVGGRSVNPYVGGENIDFQSAAQRFDIGFVASLATRVALQVLDPQRYSQLPANYLVWGREASAEFGSPFTFDLPLSVNFAQMQKRDECPVCGELQNLDGVDIEQQYGEILAGLDIIQG